MKAADGYHDIEDTFAKVKILLEHGADVNTKNELGKLNTINFTIFIYTSIYIY